jgi:glycosyltransferase involved in cell wall biosynthesis
MNAEVTPDGAQSKKEELSLGIVQSTPTQFDEPFYRYLAYETNLQFVVYYYNASESMVKDDPEMGRRVGWSSTADRGYSAVFSKGASPSRFARLVVQANHDLIIISGFSESHALRTAIAARLHGTPTGLRSDNVLPSHGGRGKHWWVKRLFYPLLFKLYKTAHPVGNQSADYLTSFGFRKESVFRFPYGVDHAWFARESAAARADLPGLRASWRLAPTGLVVCGVMKFSEREDPLTLVHAFKSARQRIPDLNLLLVGDGPLRRQVEDAAGDELGKSIALPGYQPYAKLPQVYAASDLFVHTASGAWEVSVNEALACGLPVIASDTVGAAQELVVSHSFGYTFRHADAAVLADRIVEALNDAALMARARAEAFESLALWDYPATAERLFAALRFARHRWQG